MSLRFAWILLAMTALASCTHKDGTPYTGPEIYKVTREGALLACDLSAVAAPAVASIEGMQLAPVVVAAICEVIRRFPEAIGVYATATGDAAPIGRISSGGPIVDGAAYGGR